LLFGVSFGLFGAFLLVGALSGTVSGALASSGGWIVLLGAFLFAAARGSRKQAAIRASLASVPVRELMVSNVVAVSPDSTVEEAVNQYFLPYGYGGFPVVQDGRLVGVVGVRDVQTVSNSLWALRRVADIMQTIQRRHGGVAGSLGDAGVGADVGAGGRAACGRSRRATVGPGDARIYRAFH
jgi:hypothetical protein